MAADEIKYLLELPSQILVVLASGFIAYRIAYTGKDSGHKSVDVIFFTAVFAAFSRLVIAGVALFNTGSVATWSSYGLAFIVAVAAAAFWRRAGEEWVRGALRWTGISTSDRYTSALETMMAREGHKPNQLVVRKTDGSAVMCERLADFEHAPYGPCLLGPDGSVSLYVTDSRSGQGSDWEPVPTVKNDWGVALTFIPADHVAEIELRYPLTAKALEASAQAAERSA